MQEVPKLVRTISSELDTRVVSAWNTFNAAAEELDVIQA